MNVRVEIRVVPRQGILDPQGKAVGGALESLGFGGIEEVHVGRVVMLSMEADSEAAARESATAMCRQILANPVTEDFHIRIESPQESRR